MDPIKRDEFIELKTDVKWIRLAIEGNGKKGLMERVGLNEKYRHVQSGALIILSLLIGWGVAIIY